jgi:hypothetical protein
VGLLVVALAVGGLVLLLGPLMLASGAMAMIWLRHRRDDRGLAAGWAGNGNGEGVASAEPSWWELFLARLRSFSRGKPDLEVDEPALVIGGQNGRPARVVGEAPAATPEQTAAGQSRGPAPGSADSLIPRIIGAGSRTWRLPDVAEILEEAEDVEISHDDIKSGRASSSRPWPTSACRCGWWRPTLARL